MKKQDVLDQFQSLLLDHKEAVSMPEEYRFIIGHEINEVMDDMPRYRDIVVMPTGAIPHNEIRLILIKGVRYL